MAGRLRKGGPRREGWRAEADDARPREVRPRHSSWEVGEQRQTTVSEVDGAKGGGQGERDRARHAPDPEPGKHVPRAGPQWVELRSVRCRVPQRETRHSAHGRAWPKPERPLWSVQRRQADICSWKLSTGNSDLKARFIRVTVRSTLSGGLRPLLIAASRAPRTAHPLRSPYGNQYPECRVMDIPRRTEQLVLAGASADRTIPRRQTSSFHAGGPVTHWHREPPSAFQSFVSLRLRPFRPQRSEWGGSRRRRGSQSH